MLSRGDAPGTSAPNLPMTTRRPLNLVHVTAESGFSGGEVQVFLLIEGLRKRGHQNLLVCPPRSAAAAEAQRRGIDVADTAMRSDLSAGAVHRIGRVLRSARPDLVHLHSGRATWLGGIAAWRAGLPAITTRRMDRRLRRNLRTRFLYGHALSCAVAISDAVARCLSDGGVPRERIRVVPSAVEPEHLHPQRGREDVRARLDAGASEDCLLAVASLHRRKGLDVLLDALAQLDAASRPTLWIAGEGPEASALERRARQLGVADRVRFLGHRDDVADLLAACDAFVLPSRQEGLGVAALEAMALGRPVVASRAGGLAESVLHERTGLLVEPGDAEDLARALKRLLGDPELSRKLGAAGPEHVATRYSAGSMVEAYERIYQEVLGPERGAAHAGAPR